MRFTEQQIRKMRPVDMSVDQFMEHIKGFSGPLPTRKQIEALENGEFLGVWRKPSGVWVRIHLKKIWICSYELPYRTVRTKDGKARVGKEILIGSMPLPRRLDVSKLK